MHIQCVTGVKETKLLHQMFIDSTCRNRKKIAIHDLATGKSYTYGKLLIAAIILKKKFLKYHGQYLGILLPTSAGCHLSVIATLLAGKIPVMINYATGAIKNCHYARDLCGFDTIITSSALLKKLNLQPAPGMIFLEDIMKEVTLADKLPAALFSKLPAPLIKLLCHGGKPDDTSVILFTSGSEKEPKAVQLTHTNIEQQVKILPEMVAASKDDIFAGALPLFHVFGLTITFWIPLLTGASVVTFPNPLDYRFICENVRKYKITAMVGTPTFFNGYLRRCRENDFESVRFGISGGDKLPEKLRLVYKEEHGVTLYEGYGTTETSPVISGNSVFHYRPGSIGKPVKGAEVKIIDTETDREIPAGETGKIVVRGDLVMKGYLNNYEETLLHMHNGWYDTGDMGCFDDDGFLWHKGRLKRFVKIGGEMVSLVHIEEVINNLLPEEVICCVSDLPHPVKGAEVVVATSSDNYNKLKLSLQLKLELPAIAIPKHYYVIEEMPISGTGKIDFRKVRQICLKLRENQKKNKEDFKSKISSFVQKKSDKKHSTTEDTEPQ
jgi:acyl-[acyl-carrier-protein]-phospholipid O-acyltransferase / long-chain-fatty-acid--[acyl-carrier-protein] ligase